MYEAVRVSCISRSQLVSFPGRSQCHEPLTVPVEHALDRNRVTIEIMTQISLDTMLQPGLPALFWQQVSIKIDEHELTTRSNEFFYLFVT